MSIHTTISYPSKGLKDIVHHYEFHILTEIQEGGEKFSFFPNVANGFMFHFYHGTSATIHGGSLNRESIVNTNCFAPQWIPLEVSVYEHFYSFKVFFQPGVLFDLFNIPLGTLIHRQVHMGEELDSEFTFVYEQMRENISISHCVSLIEQYLRHKLQDTGVGKDPQKALEKIFSDSFFTVSIKDASRELGFTSRHLARILHKRLGGSTRDFVRTMRFNRGLKVLQERPQISLTALSYELGYYDQSHFSREFKAITGISPRTYLKAIGGGGRLLSFENDERHPRILRRAKNDASNIGY